MTPVYDRMIAEFGDPYIPPIQLTIPPFYPENGAYASALHQGGHGGAGHAAIPNQGAIANQGAYAGQNGYAEHNGYPEQSGRHGGVPSLGMAQHRGPAPAAPGGQQWGPVGPLRQRP